MFERFGLFSPLPYPPPQGEGKKRRKERHSQIQSVSGLAEIGGAGVTVHFGINFVNTRHDMQDGGLLFHFVHQRLVNVQGLFQPLILGRIGKALLEDAGHIKDVNFTDDGIQIGQLLIFHTGGVKLGFIIVRQAQFRRGGEK